MTPLARRSRRQDGFNLLELLLVLAISGLTATLSVPALLSWASGVRLRLAAAEVQSTFALSRSYAIRHDERVAVKFRTGDDGQVTWAIYRDGDEDGVRSDDVVTGVDPEVQAPRPLQHFGVSVRFGFPTGARPCEPGNPRQRLTGLDDPIRFNRSDLASFDPMGTATPGTVYLTDGHRLAAVRVNNRAGRISSLDWDPTTGAWR